MTIDEKDVERRRPLYELFDKLGAELDAKRAAARERARRLFDELRDADKLGDLSRMGKIYKRLAAHFEREGCKGDAQMYRLDAAECTARLRRRNWVEKRKGQR
jgi:hypothetical protein